MRTQISKDLVSFPTVRRGNWHIKVSAYKDKQIMIVAEHMYNDAFVIKTFSSDDAAADFIHFLIDKDDL